MAGIRISGARRTYGSSGGEVHAVDGIDLKIADGEFVVLMGASGSGKTTLLNLIGGLDRLSAGRLEVLGTDLAGLSEARLAGLRMTSIGFVFQELNLLPELTLQENVALPLEGAGVPRAEARRRADEALARVGLAELGPRFPDEVSGGQQQRAAIARAVVGERRLLLADEPTGALDSATGTQVMRTLRELCDSGVTVVVSTHNPANAQYADRVVRMRDGRIDGITAGNSATTGSSATAGNPTTGRSA
ncbi:MAG: ABC transporter ATP-binding protein [Kitasatospora sp.]|jgi:putative ABC transport system ATP-binding protein|nr:ABC transporter ATP-binding protein [Kitasatospora sp.]